jgi:hypothetical protein
MPTLQKELRLAVFVLLIGSGIGIDVRSSSPGVSGSSMRNRMKLHGNALNGVASPYHHDGSVPCFNGKINGTSEVVTFAKDQFENMMSNNSTLSYNPTKSFRWIGPPSALVEAIDAGKVACKDLSEFGGRVRKWPESMVKCIAALRQKTGSTKTHNYNFIGSLELPGCNWWKAHERRKWLPDFVKKHFKNNDILVFTDVKSDHIPLGPFDHSNEQGDRKRVTPCHKFVDEPYYQTMMQSTFTLAPGGDHPFSWRLYEAILSGSIPVIRSMSEDFAGGISILPRKIGYKIFTTDEVEEMNSLSSAELKSIADHNYDLFLRYQTFVDGDHVPPAWKDMNTRCIDDPQCAGYVKNVCK